PDPARGLARQLVGNARQNHARLEQEDTLEVERALVVEQLPRPVQDQLRHHDDRDLVGVARDLAQVGEERLAEVAERRLADLAREIDLLPLPLAAERARLLGIEREEDRAGVVEAEGPDVVQRAERGAVDTRHEDAADRALRPAYGS